MYTYCTEAECLYVMARFHHFIYSFITDFWISGDVVITFDCTVLVPHLATDP